MKVLLIFKNKYRMVADSASMVLPQSPHEIEQKISLEEATEQEIGTLRQNPYNDQLINTIQMRKKVVT